MQTSDVWNGAEAIVVAVGASSEELRYHKSIALQVWLYGYELPGKCQFKIYVMSVQICCDVYSRPNVWYRHADTIMLFTKESVHVLTSTKKGNYLLLRCQRFLLLPNV